MKEKAAFDFLKAACGAQVKQVKLQEYLLTFVLQGSSVKTEDELNQILRQKTSDHELKVGLKVETRGNEQKGQGTLAGKDAFLVKEKATVAFLTAALGTQVKDRNVSSYVTEVSGTSAGRSPVR